MEHLRQVAQATTASTRAAAAIRARTGSPAAAAMTENAPSFADQWRA